VPDRDIAAIVGTWTPLWPRRERAVFGFANIPVVAVIEAFVLKDTWRDTL